MVRLVLSLRKAQQLGMFTSAPVGTRSQPALPLPARGGTASGAGGGMKQWITVKPFTRKDGTTVASHQRQVRRAAVDPNAAPYQQAKRTVHHELAAHATAAAETARRAGDHGAADKLHGIALGASKGGFDRTWAKHALEVLRSTHHHVGTFEEKEAIHEASTPPAKPKKAPKAKAPEAPPPPPPPPPPLPPPPPAAAAAAPANHVAKTKAIVDALNVNPLWNTRASHDSYPPPGYKPNDAVSVSLSFADGSPSGSGASTSTRYVPVPGSLDEAKKIKEALQKRGYMVHLSEGYHGVSVLGWPPADAPAEPKTTTGSRAPALVTGEHRWTPGKGSAPASPHPSGPVSPGDVFPHPSAPGKWAVVEHAQPPTRMLNGNSSSAGPIHDHVQSYAWRELDPSIPGDAEDIHIAERRKKKTEAAAPAPTTAPAAPAPPDRASRRRAAYEVGTSGPEFEQRVAEATRHWNALTDAEEEHSGAAMRGRGRSAASRRLEAASAAWNSHPDHVKAEAVRRDSPPINYDV